MFELTRLIRSYTYGQMLQKVALQQGYLGNAGM
jgi:hypothetical protein